MYFCRDCGASGWISRRLATDDRFCSDVRTINMAFASKEKDVVLLNTEMKRHEAVDDYISENATNVTLHVKMKDLSEASVSDSDTIRLRVCSKSSFLHSTFPGPNTDTHPEGYPCMLSNK